MELSFSGEIWYWRGPSPFHFVTVPMKQGELIKEIAAGVTYGWGVIPVTAKIGATEWTTSLFPKEGSYAVPIKNLVRTKEKIGVDDKVTITLKI